MIPSESIVLTAAGDISLGDHPALVSIGVRSHYERVAARDGQYPFGRLDGLFQGSDLAFGNLETVLSDSGLRPDLVRSREMRGHPGAVDRLIATGFNVLNVANNHILQHGVEAFHDTVRVLRERGIAVVGEGRAEGRESVPALVSVNSLRVAFLGYAFEPDKYFAAPPLYAFGPDCDIPAEIARARQRADIVICSMHWGDEFIRRPPAENVAKARRLVDAGAHLILGHHPHVYQGVERYRHGLIAYSLGNFVFDMLWHKWLRHGLVLTVRLSRRGVEEVHPRFVSIGPDYQPVPAPNSHELLADLDRISRDVCDPDGEQRYAADYRRLVRSNRVRCYLHVLRHRSRYDSVMLRQILKRPFAARVSRWRKGPRAVDQRPGNP
jgi:poly-gamma-glutamate synthesis protein (capsule biosynthesis protein)